VKFEIDESRRGTIQNVHHVPDFANSQLSASQFDKKGYGSLFVNGKYALFKAHMAEDWMPKLQTEAIETGELNTSGLYTVEIKKSSKMAAITMKPKPITLEMAHLLFGHISDDHIVKSTKWGSSNG
jgi:hypothetical protein